MKPPPSPQTGIVPNSNVHAASRTCPAAPEAAAHLA
jgi:hypothetical protein